MSLGSTGTRTTSSLNRMRKEMGRWCTSSQMGGSGGGGSGYWEPPWAPELGRRNPILHALGRGSPGAPLPDSSPPTPLRSAGHPEFGFWAKALLPIQLWLPPGQSSWYLGGDSELVLSKRPPVQPRLGPSGPISLGGPPPRGWEAGARPSPSLAMDVTWPLLWGQGCSGALCEMSGGRAELAGWLSGWDIWDCR